ncbi:MAG: VanZ family protein [Acidobacteriota bacterium]
MARAGVLREAWLWGPVLAYVCVIIFLSVQSYVALPTVTPDYLAHAAEYFGLAILTARALNNGLARCVAPRHILVAFLLCLACAIVDELLQKLSSARYSDYTDVLSDAVGAGLALGVLHLGQRAFLRSDPA